MELCSLHNRGIVACYNQMMAFESSIIYTTKIYLRSQYEVNRLFHHLAAFRVVERKDTSLVSEIEGGNHMRTYMKVTYNGKARTLSFLISFRQLTSVSPAVFSTMISKNETTSGPFVLRPLAGARTPMKSTEETRERWKTIGQ